MREVLGSPAAGEPPGPPSPPGHRAGARVDPGRRGALAVGVVALLAGAITLLWVLAGRPHAAPIAPTGADFPPASAAPSRAPAGSAAASPHAEVVVDVAGKVRHPGLYRLPAGSRVDDAVRAAGGVQPGVSLVGLNLAARLVDGQQVPVGIPVAGGVAAAGAAAGGGGSRAGPVDLNLATLEQLDALPGVGPVLAQHILDWRAVHGRFGSVGQLDAVPGIGSAKFATLRPLVTV